ncbi:hypothetical protein LNP74_05150 [Klebsiella pneumoniae subsp. pneumoniae]|nr:hypothetical protein [Klebsiella pneumoniae subsp. pneumoniae]
MASTPELRFRADETRVVEVVENPQIQIPCSPSLPCGRGSPAYTAFSGSHQDAITKTDRCPPAWRSGWQMPVPAPPPSRILGCSHEGGRSALTSQSGKSRSAWLIEQNQRIWNPRPLAGCSSDPSQHRSAGHR